MSDPSGRRVRWVGHLSDSKPIYRIRCLNSVGSGKIVKGRWSCKKFTVRSETVREARQELAGEGAVSEESATGTSTNPAQSKTIC
jgi:hypothetical protein